jgi:hypothetical protein
VVRAQLKSLWSAHAEGVRQWNKLNAQLAKADPNSNRAIVALQEQQLLLRLRTESSSAIAKAMAGYRKSGSDSARLRIENAQMLEIFKYMKENYQTAKPTENVES